MGRRPLTWLLSATALIVAIYLALCLLLYTFQRRLLYFPTPAPAPTQPQVPRFALPVDGAVLQVAQHTVADASPGDPALIYFGGNAEVVDQNFDQLAAALPRTPFYLVNYRGYGGSSGTPSEAALFADALSVFDHVRRLHTRVAVLGRSLGSGVAVYLATQRPIDRMIVVTPYDSIEQMARTQYPWVPVGWLLKDRFDSAGRADRIEAPTLVLVAEHDELIPQARTDALIARLPPPLTTVHTLAGTGHNTIDTPPEYLRLLAGFLADR